MANTVRLRTLTRAEHRILRAKVTDRRLAVRLHCRYRVIAEVARGCSVAEAADRVGYTGSARPRRAGVSSPPDEEFVKTEEVRGLLDDSSPQGIQHRPILDLNRVSDT